MSSKWYKTGVYEILNLMNSKRYVGSASKSLSSRLRGHRAKLKAGRSVHKHLQAAWNKYGMTAFRFRVLEMCPPEDCLAREQYYIDLHKSADRKYGYNGRPTAESNRGAKWSEESKARMSAAARRRLQRPGELARLAEIGRAAHTAPGAREKMAAGFGGKIHTPEARKRIGEAAKGRKKSRESIERGAEKQRGKKLSDAQKAQISARQKGTKHSEETKAKMRASHAKRLTQPEEIEKLRNAQKERWAKSGAREKASAAQAKRWAKFRAKRQGADQWQG